MSRPLYCRFLVFTLLPLLATAVTAATGNSPLKSAEMVVDNNQPPVLLGTGPAADPYENARRLFRRLEPLVASQPELLDQHRTALADYPLLPYLEADVLNAAFPKVDERVLGAFLLRHDGAPFAEQLREDWLRRLAGKNDAAGFLLYYRPSRNLELRCHYLRFALSGGSNPTALPGFAEIWLTAKPLPSACASVEKLWIAAGERTPERIWQRLELAVEEDEGATIRALRPLLPVAERPLTELWQRLRKHPLDVTKSELFRSNSPEIWRLKAWALERLAWRDRDEALAAWDLVTSDPAFPIVWREQAGRTFALALAGAGHPAASRFLAAIPARLTDERVAAARVVDAMRRLNWTDTDYWLNQLPASEYQSNRWRYFSGRSLAAQDRSDSAVGIWQSLAGNLDYYGFLARGQLGQRNRMSPPPLAVSADTVARIRALPAMQRAREWLALDRQVDARREWYALSQTLSPAELHAAAVVANDWNWPDRAIAALGKAPATGAWELRFPLAHADTLTSESRYRQIHPTWAFAITRQESMFISDAKSGAGALGLMQLMPETARQTARKYRIHYDGSHDLIRPNQNIRIGVAHLAELIQRNAGNYVYATAAYNAGQSRVDRWREQFADLPLDIWIETIPFQETQNYVKNVMAYSLIYAERLGQDAQVFDLLSDSARAPLPTPPPLAGPPAP
ncbi:lytic transglycosylase domain-containing protein [Permianibacter sp. IMCC34836]|uniref:lytic transglycosylase domain-containing protein n=1 Tax=Permianibacter fluminis TaxID=2738515 RepID=UPI00155807F9|nr:lytic transglycosylase domain-containing protein [Permianibacter fluminis]NQD38804.1 lytic transglycosylase domain-containing protein [Permianibacter fluminis]